MSRKESESHEEASMNENENANEPQIQGQGGRTYYVSIPIRPLTGDVEEEHLERLSLYYTIYGVLFSIVGAVAIVFPLLFGFAVEQLLAWLLVLGGGVTILQFLLVCGAPGTTSFLLLGALHLGIGLWMLLQPIAGGTALTFVIAGWFLGHGILKLLMACQLSRLTSWPAVVISGLLSIVSAFAIMALTPSYGLKLLGIIFGIDLCVTGVSLLLIALMAFIGKGHRCITDLEAAREPLLTEHAGRRHAATGHQPQAAASA